MSTLYDLHLNDTYGNDIPLEKFKGKVLLIVNTATKCGLAGQFEELEALHQVYKDKGLVVIGFPCDQFLGQEPETNESMVNVCKLNFGVTFLLSEKIDVNGKGTHPIFNYLKTHSKSGLTNRIKWNFTKFLVSKDGETIERFAPPISPESLRSNIEAML